MANSHRITEKNVYVRQKPKKVKILITKRSARSSKKM